MKSFLRPFTLTADSSRAVVSYWRNNELKVLVNHLDMTIVVDWDVKPQNKQRIAVICDHSNVHV